MQKKNIIIVPHVFECVQLDVPICRHVLTGLTTLLNFYDFHKNSLNGPNN